jgi:fucose 4-O-acetylase-like acetyltransferase
MKETRDAYWDNLKAVLIFLVVLGHFLLVVMDEGDAVRETLYWVYFFHMPAFVFVSGYFSKSYVRKDGKTQKLVGFLILYVAYTVCIWIIDLIFTHRFSPDSLLQTSSATWYMLAMFMWHLLIPFVSRIKPIYSFPLFAGLSVAVGLFKDCGTFLVLQKAIVFFPFFLAGFYFDGGLIKKIKPWVRAAGGALFAAYTVALFLFFDKLSTFLKVVFGTRAFSLTGLSNKEGLVFRPVWLVASTIVLFALMCLIPRRRLFFTYIGERTLAIYVLHRLIRDVITRTGLDNYLGKNYVLLASCVAISLAITFICSLKPFTLALNKLSRLDFMIKPRQQLEPTAIAEESKAGE